MSNKIELDENGMVIDKDLRYLKVMLHNYGEEKRTLLGDVRYHYYDKEKQQDRLVVTHFNGEKWPIEPLASEVEII